LNSEQYAKLLEAATSQGAGHRASQSLDAVPARIRPMKQELHQIHIKHAACDGGTVYHHQPRESNKIDVAYTHCFWIVYRDWRMACGARAGQRRQRRRREMRRRRRTR
jgi:hypothetical protein